MTRGAMLLIFALCMARCGLAQDVAGTWTGTLAGDNRLGRFDRLTVSIAKGRDGKLSAEAYGGANRNVVYSCPSISLTGWRLSFSIAVRGTAGGVLSFEGALSEDGNSIQGRLQGASLKLERVGRPRTAASPPVPAAAPIDASTTDPAALLEKARARLADTAQRLLQYTCLETIDRSYYSSSEKKLGSDVMTEAPKESCDGRKFDTDRRLLPYAEDRLRLEVAVSHGKEIQAWVGASFDSRSVYDLVASGPKSTGSFGPALIDVFENPDRQYHFIGRQREGARELLVYSFQVPVETSHYVIKAGDTWKKTGYYGWFSLDAAAAELAKISSETLELPADTAMCRARTITGYHYQQIGDGQFLIPSKSEFDTISSNAAGTHSVTTFSACHEYAAESSLRFEDDTTAATVKAAPKIGAPLPAGLSLTLALLVPIDTSTAAAGDAVSARVTKAVRAPGSNEILVAAGAIVRGRILQMQHLINSAQFQISIRYDVLEQNGTVTPLAIRLDRDLRVEKARVGNGFASHGTEFSLPPASAPGESGSWFSAPSTGGRYIMAAGSESKWVTAGK
jgi:hypothetical protein